MKRFGCLSYIFEITGWLANIIQIIIYIKSGGVEISGNNPIIPSGQPRYTIAVAIIVLYGLSAAAASIWYVLYHRAITVFIAFAGFFILQGSITTILVVPLLYDFEQLFSIQVPNDNFLPGLLIWGGALVISGLVGWFVCQIWTAPEI
jgi:hypothetical protein